MEVMTSHEGAAQWKFHCTWMVMEVVNTLWRGHSVDMPQLRCPWRDHSVEVPLYMDVMEVVTSIGGTIQ